MPKSEWTKENMSWTFLFFPWIGAVIGAGIYVIWLLKEQCLAYDSDMAELTFVILMVVFPLAVTGGIHMDGFMDTKDALSSYVDREKRLAILKDPHAGAFAVLSCCVYLLCSVGIYASAGRESIKVIALGFLLSRTLSGCSVICFPQARKEGLAASFSKNAEQKTVFQGLVVYAAVLCGAILWAGKLSGGAALVAAGGMFWYYYRMSVKKFGGVTGDLAGYFLQMCEIVMAAAAVAADILVKVCL